MRVLVVHPGADFSVADVYSGWMAGLRALGCEVGEFKLNDRLNFFAEAKVTKHEGTEHEDTRYAFTGEAVARLACEGIKAACYDWWPDVVFVFSGFFVPPDFYDIMRARGHRVVLVHTESPYEDDRQLPRAPFADLNVVNDPTNLARFEALARTVYLPHAYNPEIHRPGEPDPDIVSEFCFVGTGYPSRVEFFEKVDWTGIDATFAGYWRGLADDSPLMPLMAHGREVCCPQPETVRLYQSTQMSCNVYRKEANQPGLSGGWSVTPREIELAAMGVFYARQPRPEGDNLFPMLPTFTEPGELRDLIGYYLANPDTRQAAAVTARAAVEGFTFENHAAQVLRLLETLPVRAA